MRLPEIEIVNDREAPARAEEIEALLKRVYVEAGFTDPELAGSLFAAPAVRERGQVLLARHGAGGPLVGMVIVVSPHSPARRMASDDEAEMHLLAVAPERRGSGIGQALVEAAMDLARTLGFRRMVLWTQPAMEAAQRLYGRAGFLRAPGRDWRRGDRSFLVYERAL